MSNLAKNPFRLEARTRPANHRIDISQATKKRARYFLSTHIHVGYTGKHILLLDLQRDRYLGIEQNDSLTLAHWIDGWPILAQSMDPSENAASCEVLMDLIRDRIVTTDPSVGKPATPAKTARAEYALIDGYSESKPGITVTDVCYYIISVVTISSLMRWSSLKRIVHRMQLRKARQVQVFPEKHTSYLSRAREKMEIFRRLQPLLFTAPNACLLDSLVLMEFFFHYRIPADLVIGAAAEPFRAHSWLQHENVVLNDTPQRVWEYVPILVI